MRLNSEGAMVELLLKLLFIILFSLAVLSFILCVITFSGYFLLLGCILLVCVWLVRKEFKISFIQRDSK